MASCASGTFSSRPRTSQRLRPTRAVRRQPWRPARVSRFPAAAGPEAADRREDEDGERVPDRDDRADEQRSPGNRDQKLAEEPQEPHWRLDYTLARPPIRARGPIPEGLINERLQEDPDRHRKRGEDQN